MKNNYDLKKMREIPHPFMSDNRTDWVNDISDAEFEQKLLELDPDERTLALKYRKKTRRSLKNTKSRISV